jgi:hypothetical protein
LRSHVEDRHLVQQFIACLAGVPQDRQCRD